LHIIN